MYIKNITVEDIKLYSFTEWFHEDKKNYQQVFLSNEVDYIYVEVKFTNLKRLIFQKNAKLILQFYKIENNNFHECGIIKLKKTYRKRGQYVFREGWGNKEKGTYWQEGKHIAIVYLNDVKIGEKEFWIAPPWLPHKENPFFDIDEVKTFTASHEGIGNRNYQETFIAQEIKYLFVELLIKNKLDENWKGEFTLTYLTETGDIKGRIISIKTRDEVEKNGLILGWGAEELGSWYPRVIEYRLCFMNKLIYQSKIELT